MLSTKQLQQEIKEIIKFVKRKLDEQGIEKVVIAVSGGIDSAVSLTLLSRAIDKKNIIPVFLPNGNQTTDDSYEIVKWNKISKSSVKEINIASVANSLFRSLKVPKQDTIRYGNIPARIRMIAVFDIAKKNKALVMGSENRSEKYLGYYTRFGDEASDIEPIQHLYKTEVRAIAKELKIPNKFIEKAPSAELCEGQSDEKDFGFSYDDADKILEAMFDKPVSEQELLAGDEYQGVKRRIVEKVINRVRSFAFKQNVPYIIDNSINNKKRKYGKRHESSRRLLWQR